METANNSKEIANAVNELATAIYGEYEMYTVNQMPVDSDYFTALEEIMNITSAIGELLGNENLNSEDKEMYMDTLQAYTKERILNRQDLVKQHKEREYRIKVAKEMKEVEARIKAEMGL